MVTAESLQVRRIVGSLERGSDLIDELKAVCARFRVHAGELRAIGALEQVELCAFDQGRKRATSPRLITGSLELLSLSGNISEQAGAASLVARVTVMRDRDSGMEVLGGQLLSARVFAVEFVIEAFDDVLLRRAHDPNLGIPVWKEAISESEVVPEAESLADHPEPTVDQVPAVEVPSVAAPAVAPPPAAPLDIVEDVDLAAGDVILHPKFRRCVVQRIEGNNEFVQVRLRNGRVVRLSLDIIELTPQGTENGQRVFSARIF